MSKTKILFTVFTACLAWGAALKAQNLGWDELDAAQQRLLGPLAEQWESLSLQRRRRLQAGVEQWLSMSAEQKALARQRLAQWNSMSAQRQARILALFQRFNTLPPSVQERLKKRHQWYQALPREQQKQLKQEWLKLRRPPAQGGLERAPQSESASTSALLQQQQGNQSAGADATRFSETLETGFGFDAEVDDQFETNLLALPIGRSSGPEMEQNSVAAPHGAYTAGAAMQQQQEAMDSPVMGRPFVSGMSEPQGMGAVRTPSLDAPGDYSMDNAGMGQGVTPSAGFGSSAEGPGPSNASSNIASPMLQRPEVLGTPSVDSIGPSEGFGVELEGQALHQDANAGAQMTAPSFQPDAPSPAAGLDRGGMLNAPMSGAGGVGGRP
jgi:hypothetical protein